MREHKSKRETARPASSSKVTAGGRRAYQHADRWDGEGEGWREIIAICEEIRADQDERAKMEAGR